uniref:EamA domain-containing protein n=1 Tax=Trichuris muris TaxID=70415 RepID=A0A5S6Q1B2_TRIMR
MENAYSAAPAQGCVRRTKWESVCLANYVVATIACNAMVKIGIQRLYFSFPTFICFSSATVLSGICIVFRKLLGRPILEVALKDFSHFILPATIIYAMLCMQMIMRQDDSRFAETVRFAMCFSPVAVLLCGRLMSTGAARDCEVVIALIVAFAAVLANKHILASLEPPHCLAGILWMVLLCVLFAWFDHFKRSDSADAATALFRISTCLWILSLFLLVIGNRCLLDAFYYFEMNRHHSFPYIVPPVLFLCIACRCPGLAVVAHLLFANAVCAVGRMA